MCQHPPRGGIAESGHVSDPTCTYQGPPWPRNVDSRSLCPVGRGCWLIGRGTTPFERRFCCCRSRIEAPHPLSRYIEGESETHENIGAATHKGRNEN